MNTELNFIVVDDETNITDLFGIIGKEFNFKMHLFNDAKKALDFFISNPNFADLIITDYNMHEINGVELARKVREINNKIPIIMLTAYSNIELIDEAAKLDIVEFIEKPFDVENIVQSINNHVSKKKGREARIDLFYNQCLEILELVSNNKIPCGFSSVDFIIKTLEKNEFHPGKLGILKEVNSYLSEQIQFMDAQEIYNSLKDKQVKRKMMINRALKLLKEIG